MSFLSSDTPIAGMTKDAFDAYLFKDGKPRALTSENTSDVPELILDGEGNAVGLDISKALATRDIVSLRLSTPNWLLERT